MLAARRKSTTRSRVAGVPATMSSSRSASPTTLTHQGPPTPMGCPGQHTSHPSRGRMARMKRGLKLGFGIPLVLLGLFMTIGGMAVVVVVGPEGSFPLPQNQGDSTANGLMFADLD